MVKEVEGKFTLSDGTELYEKVWEAEDKPTAHLIFLHGFSDHINAYYSLFPTLSSPPYNITIHGIDQRGWGRSCTTKSSRGLTGPTDQVIKDISEYVEYVATQVSSSSSSSTPIFLMGHSMGGGEALYYALTRHTNSTSTSTYLSGLILESPFIDFHPSAAPSSLVVTLGRMASRLRPRMQLKQALNAEVMSRDPAVVKAWVEDPLCHDTGTLEGLAGLLSRTGELAGLAKGENPAVFAVNSGQVSLEFPVLWLHGTADGVCDFNSSKMLYDRVLKGEGDADRGVGQVGLSNCKWYEGAYHKLHAEPDGVGEQFARDIGEWIVKVVQSKTGNTAVAAGDDSVKSRL